MRVAFLGLGSLWMPMAAELCRMGHEVVAWDWNEASPAEASGSAALPGGTLSSRGSSPVGRSSPPGGALPMGRSSPLSGSPLPGGTSPLGSIAEPAGSIAEAITGANIAVSAAGNDQAIHHLVLRAGLLDAMGTDTVHLCISPVGIPEIRHLSEMHAARHQPFVSAPILPGPGPAEGGTPWIAAAGPAEALERVRPLLEQTGRRMVVVGSVPWHANLVACGASRIAGGLQEDFADIYAMMRKAGIPLERFLQVANVPIEQAAVPGDAPPEDVSFAPGQVRHV